jgi:hypothetical protein
MKKKGLAALGAIVDTVLAYRRKKARKAKKTTKTTRGKKSKS